MRSLPRVVLGLAAGLGLAACAPDPVSVFIEADCEWSNPLHCMLPWPSDRWLVEDSSTPTGLRLEYDGDRFPRNTSDEPFDAEPYRRPH